MNSATTDRRVRRTRELALRALLSLVQEKGYDRITVQDILDEADIGRSTFYAHYRDKDDLLRSGFEDIRAALVADSSGAEKAGGKRAEFLQPVLVVFQHVEEHRHLWKPLARKGGADLVIRILREGVADLVYEEVRLQFPGGNETQVEAAVQFIAGGCMGLLIWWLENDVGYSAEDIHSIFRRLTTQGVRRFLAAA